MTSAHTNVVTSLPRFLPPNDIMCLYRRTIWKTWSGSRFRSRPMIKFTISHFTSNVWHWLWWGCGAPLLYLVSTWLNDCSPVGTYIHSHANDLESRCVSWINAPHLRSYIQIILSQHIKYLVVMQGSYHTAMTIFRSVTAAHNSIGTRTYWWMIST